ncbi:aldehyde dehydrogenase family protein [Ramlibacter rhizophilus]|uniref:Toluenesulfonate aldehyde dehydrogenase TsaD n=2 Tax=Ramlibacter rhizophilus TaxID=1781167 RepID=A0A4Z0BHN7_9BURK|nr:aldehyde dehydrogenase family protein [Ramlibacter rhizophilus]TFY98825.1 aldehyde dehydrogenase family protein [Ramlibacter rhizophilus]
MHQHLGEFYIDGRWVAPSGGRELDVFDPATGEPFARIAVAGVEAVDGAVMAARRAFEDWAASSVAQRIALLSRVEQGFQARQDDLCRAMSQEMGVPISAARSIHFGSGPAHLKETMRVLERFAFDELRGTTLVTREPIGVCALITPWNFPINQVVCKIAPALAAGCTMVLKPSEVSPLSALIIADILDEAGVPEGVFNLVNGDGAGTGQALASHPEVDMVSFTGSTRAGIAIAKAAADTVKRVAQELGGKSPNILLADADFPRAVTLGANRCFNNSGQSCVAPTRMLVPRARMQEAAHLAAEAARTARVGQPSDPQAALGPVATRAQFEKVQRLIGEGIAAGARVVAGGPGRPEGFERGWFVRPTVFADVDPSMSIAREEIFGPVLCLIAYEDEEDAIRIANDTCYGLAAYVQSADPARARRVARRLRAGNVQLNYPPVDRGAPFGGYKQSGNGREWGEFGLHEYLEIKGIQGWEPPA